MHTTAEQAGIGKEQGYYFTRAAASAVDESPSDTFKQRGGGNTALQDMCLCVFVCVCNGGQARAKGSEFKTTLTDKESKQPTNYQCPCLI